MAVTKCTRLRGVIVGAVILATRSNRTLCATDTYGFVLVLLESFRRNENGMLSKA